MSFNKANLVSKEYTTTETWVLDTRREYFFLCVLSGDVTVSFGGGDGEIPVVAGGHYEPQAVPTGQVIVTVPTSATYVVNSDTHP